MLKDAEINPVLMGETVIENSQVEKYLGDQIHEDGCEASISATIDGRINGAIKAGKEIVASLNHPATMGHKMAEVAVTEYASKVISKLISNCDSRIDLTDNQITRMQNVQDNYFKDVFQVCASGTPLCMIRLDSQTLHIKYQIILRKIKQIRKTISKEDDNLAKKALLEGQYTCAGEDLLTECIEWCKKLDIRCVTKGIDPNPQKQKWTSSNLNKDYGEKTIKT